MIEVVGQAQELLAETLARTEWFAEHRVEVVQQNKAELKYLLERQVATLKGVLLVIGCDAVENVQTGLEMVVTMTALEYVPLNRGNDGFVTAIEVIEAVIDALDGEWWHFDRLEHTTPGERVLECTATFRAIFDREQLNNGGDNG